MNFWFDVGSSVFDALLAKAFGVRCFSSQERTFNIQRPTSNDQAGGEKR